MSSSTLTVPGARHAPEVVAAEVDEHDVLGALLLVGEQVGAQAAVLGGGRAARARAGERAREHRVALDAHERLGARAHERHVAACARRTCTGDGFTARSTR